MDFISARRLSFIVDQFLSAVLCLSAPAVLADSAFPSHHPCLLVFVLLLVVGVGRQGLAAVVDHSARQVYLDGEDVRLLQDGVAVVVVVRHARDEALQLEHDVLNCRREKDVRLLVDAARTQICYLSFIMHMQDLHNPVSFQIVKFVQIRSERIRLD